MLATFTVDTADDTVVPSDGMTSLREAVLTANVTPGFDVIDFDPILDGVPITLSIPGRGDDTANLGDLDIFEDLTIQGRGATSTIIDGDGIDRILHVFDSITLSVQDVTLQGGDTTDLGGGILVDDGGTLSLSQTTLTGNSSLNGGAIANRGTISSISAATISGNSADNGAGIYNSATGRITSISYSSISSNTASRFGGGLFNAGVITGLYQSTIASNTATISGGGIQNDSGIILLISQNTISSNTANTGGGIYNNAAANIQNITGSTIAENSANNTGDGVYNAGTIDNLTSTIIGNNTSFPTPTDLVSPGQVNSANDNLIESAIGHSITNGINGNIVGLDPQMGGLAANGGFTLTHALTSSSPAIDVGSNPDGEVVDQRGSATSRTVGFGTDIGAFEIQSFDLIVTTAEDELDNAYVENDLSLREAIEIANLISGTHSITFDAALAGSTIGLALGELTINREMSITGLGAAQTTIDAGGLSRVFNIILDSGDYTFEGMTITGGSVAGAGGAIRSASPALLTITDSIITGNATTGAANRGGGIFTIGTLALTGSTVSGNSTDGGSADGGGIYARGVITLSDSTVSGNSTEGLNADGGGIYGNDAVNLINSTVSGNFTVGSNAAGGGIRTFNNVYLTNSTVSGNSTGDSGGGISTGSDVYLTNSTLSGNSAVGEGGGIYTNSSVYSYNSTISGNSTSGDFSDGGGIYAESDVTLENSTVTGNSTSGLNADGGGVYAVGEVILSSSIVAGNNVFGAGATGPDIDSSPVTPTHSLIGDNAGTPLIEAQVPDINGNLIGSAAGGGIIDPLLGTLADNGGTTETHALLIGSPAIDAGDNPSGFATDQRDLPFSRDDGNGPDAGAFEVQSLSLVVTTADDELDATFDALDLSLREAIDLANRNSGADTITFDAGLANIPINLTLGELAISEELSITGLGDTQTTIDAGRASRIILISSASGDFSFSEMMLTGGLLSSRGGAIRSNSSGSLTIDNASITGNSTTGDLNFGGGIFTLGDLYLINSTVSGNSTSGYSAHGGGIASFGNVSITNSTISGNSIEGSKPRGGGIWARGGNIYLTNSTLSGNSTDGEQAHGGGAFSRLGNINLTGSTVSNNSTIGTSSHGAGIYGGVVTLNDSTITENSTLGERSRGGGIFALNNAFLTDSTVSGNSTTGYRSYGGGILSSGEVSIDNSTITGNSTTGDEATGGGIRATGNVTLTNNSFVTGNFTEGLDADGGGILSGAAVNLTDSDISGNYTTGISSDGGGISATGNATLTNSTVSGNSARANSAAGGGISTSANVVLTSSSITENYTSGTFGTGGGVSASGTVTLTDSTVSGNFTTADDGHGGGIYATGDVNLTNSTISSNSVTGAGSDGGGIHGFAAVNLNNSTVTANSAQGDGSDGGGIFAGVEISLVSSIAAENTVTGISVRGPDLFSPVITTDHSLVGDNTDTSLAESQTFDFNGNLIGSAAGSGVIDPLLDSLADNGGPTLTHALLVSSPAVNTGDNPLLLNFDQRGAGFPRTVSATIDMGAFELQTLSLVVTTADDELDVGFDPADLSLREAITLTNNSVGADFISFSAALDGIPITLNLAGTDEDLSATGDLDITDDVSIIGRGQGNTIIDGGGIDRVFEILSGNNFFTDVTVQGGNVTGTGGGVFINNGASLTLTRSTVSGNTSDFGGGLYNSGTLDIFDSLITNNTATTGAGGITNTSLINDISGSTISNNTGGIGAGINNNGLLTNITSSMISGNVGSSRGAGINNDVTITNITDSVISDNRSSSFGGGISNQSTIGDITNSTFSNNYARLFAGGIWLSAAGSIDLISGSTISQNQADGDAGGIGNTGLIDVISNSTISRNESILGRGGGMFSSGTINQITNSTVADNLAQTNGGGIWNTGTVTSLESTIIADNSSPARPDLWISSGAINSANNNLIGDADGHTITNGANGNLVGVRSQLLPLIDNGGSTLTHSLLPGSPAIDAGTNPNVLTEDQRGAGFSRTIGGAVDIGAFEQTAVSLIGLVVTTADDELDSFFDSNDLSLREAIAIANALPGADTITFSPILDGVPIVVTINGTGDDKNYSGDFNVNEDLTILGRGEANTIIDGGGLDRVFEILTGTADFSDLTIQNGSTTANGGGIYVNPNATLILSRSTVSGNDGLQGGGISNRGTSNLYDNTLTGNSATFNGGGLFNNGTIENISGSTFDNNSADRRGGGLNNTGSGVINLITGSSFSLNSSSYGGGIYNNIGGAISDIDNSTISENVVTDTGGGIYNLGTLTNISQSNIDNNQALSGGGIYHVSDSDLSISGTSISGNQAANLGGGVYNAGSIINISQSNIDGNQSRRGGGIYNIASIGSLSTSTVSGNQAAEYGAGIYNDGDLNISETTIANNTTPSYGGGLYNDGTLSISSSTISGNSATGGGGGLFNADLITTISNSTISGNSGDFGGGIYNNGTITRINNSTLAENIADTGGGIYHIGSSIDDLSSTIIATNSANNAPDLADDSVITNAFNNLIENPSGHLIAQGVDGNIIGSDPLLNALADNGGLTQTHSLKFGSPAIEAGINPDLLQFDQRGVGFNRISGQTIDIGAFELQNTAPVLDAVGDKAVTEETLLSFTVTATDAEVPPGVLTYSLGGLVPAGASIDPDSGLFSWTPSETQGPATLTFDIVVTDNGDPQLSDRETISVTISESNAAPILGPIGDRAIDEESLLAFTATATDSDDLDSALTFSLSGAVPTGASINPSTGLFTWTPTEDQGPGVFAFDVVVSDDGNPNLSDRTTLTLAVNEVNVPPTELLLDPVEFVVDETAANGTLIGSFSVVDQDPLEQHTFFLLDDAGGRFSLIDDQLILADNSLLDSTVADSHQVTVLVRDSAGNQLEKTVDIRLIAAPADIFLDSSTVEENAEENTFIGNIVTRGLNRPTIFLIGDAEGRFTLSGKRLLVADGSKLDFELNTTHEIVILSIEIDGTIIEKTLTVTVTDVLDPPILAKHVFAVEQNAPQGSSVGIVSLTEMKSTPLLFKIIQGNDGEAFTIDDFTGEIRVNNPDVLDKGTTPKFELLVQATDANDPPQTAMAGVTINVFDEENPPTKIELLPVLVGDDDFVSMRVLRGLGKTIDIEDAIQKVRSEQGGFFDSTAAIINHHDPETAENKGLFPDSRIAFPSNTFRDDDNFLVVYRGAFNVPEGQGGQWTFGVHSSEGFAFNILDQEFTSASGLGFIDPGSPSTLAQLDPKDDRGTRGVMELSPGNYNFEFVTYENSGDAFWELFAAPGAFQDDADTNTWRLLGTEGGLQFVDNEDDRLNSLPGRVDDDRPTVFLNIDSGEVYLEAPKGVRYTSARILITDDPDGNPPPPELKFRAGVANWLQARNVLTTDSPFEQSFTAFDNGVKFSIGDSFFIGKILPERGLFRDPSLIENLRDRFLKHIQIEFVQEDVNAVFALEADVEEVPAENAEELETIVGDLIAAEGQTVLCWIDPASSSCVDVISLVETQDARVAPGPQVAVNEDIILDFFVFTKLPSSTNRTDISVMFKPEADDDFGLTIPDIETNEASPNFNFNIGDSIAEFGTLDSNEAWHYSVVISAQADLQRLVFETESFLIPGGGGNPIQEITSFIGEFAHYVGIGAEIEIENITDLPDSEDPPGPSVPVDDDVIRQFEVTNTGDAPLENISVNVTDDEVDVAVVLVDMADGDARLDEDETWLYEATGAALVGLREFTARVEADVISDNAGTVVISDEEDSHYCGSRPTEAGVFTLDVDQSLILEDGGEEAAFLTVSRPDDGGICSDLEVFLSSSDESEAAVPASVIIPAGETSVLVPIAAIDDPVLDGLHEADITASAADFSPAAISIMVDDEGGDKPREAGDANDDGQFDLDDLFQILAADKFGQTGGVTWAEGDWDGDEDFDVFDLIAALITENFLQGSYATLADDVFDEIGE